MPGQHERQPPALAEISESAATGSVAALYADIRETLGADLVNLVYRHLATVPGALEWAWANLGPHFRSGEFDAQAAMLRERVQQAFSAWPAAFQFATGHAADLASAAQLAQVYTLNNSRNLMAFRHLLDEGAVGAAAAAPPLARQIVHPAAAAGPAVTLPPIPSWDTINSVDAETVRRLNRLGEAGEPAIVASLYRHLALWPAVLGDVEAALVQLDARRDIARALAFTVDASRSIARAHPLAMPAAAPAAVDAALRARLRVFADVTIPKMVPVGLALETAFTAATVPTLP
ncbi:hypothetical protein BH11PSE7_BH11PSE7_15950 [soil metagenome]